MKIRKRLIVLALLTVAFISAMAQQQQFDYTIYGVVEDSITHEGEPYATLSIYRKGHEEKAVQMAVTDANGKFKVMSKGEGDYVLEVKSVSRTLFHRQQAIQKPEPRHASRQRQQDRAERRGGGGIQTTRKGRHRQADI